MPASGIAMGRHPALLPNDLWGLRAIHAVWRDNKPAFGWRVFYYMVGLSDPASGVSLGDPGIQQDDWAQEGAVQVESEETPVERTSDAGKTCVFGLLRQTGESALG